VRSATIQPVLTHDAWRIWWHRASSLGWVLSVAVAVEDRSVTISADDGSIRRLPAWT